MIFLTKTEIREQVETFLEGMPNNLRIPLSTNIDDEFLHIGEPIEKTISKYQTFLTSKHRDEMEIELIDSIYDKEIRQGNFSR